MCVLMSHGYYDKVALDGKMMWADHIWGTDVAVALRLITERFSPKKCTSLAGKPKIFIIQVNNSYKHCTIVFFE